jgi:phenylalanyl-tRNA synthetase alpha subunit
VSYQISILYDDQLTTLAFMEEFFRKTGNTKLRFKPAYNPYTEVSLLVPVYA